ncbi:hypothetical protein BDW22DRAFT_1354123 [Trametopsis cervina]|nr:hypothetical protein BDW22DRAFT_1354123 [Trametopsis cervina]
MKRPSEDATLVLSKKIKTAEIGGSSEEPPEDPVFTSSNLCKATDIHEHGVREDGYLVFRVYMKWDKDPARVHIQAQSNESKDVVRFDVFFQGTCARYFQSTGLQFDIGDVVWLSLRGASINKKTSSKASMKTLPMDLIYDTGVCLRFEAKKKPLPAGMVVDSWKSQELAQPLVRKGGALSQDDWFATPPVNPTQEVDSGEAVPPNHATVLGVKSTPPVNIITARSADPPPPLEEGSISKDRAAIPVKAATDGSSFSAGQRPQAAPPKKLYRNTGSKQRKSDAVGHSSRKASPIVPESTAGPSNLKSGPLNTNGDHLPDSASRVKRTAKKQKKREEKKAALENGSTTTEVQHPDPVVPSSPKFASVPSTVSIARTSDGSAKSSPPPARALTVRPLIETVVPDASRTRENNTSYIESRITTDTDTTTGPSCQLAELNCGRSSCIIGVVTLVGAVSISASSEKYIRIHIVDPSNADEDNLEAGFTVTCFAKRVSEHLPSPIKGDVLIMRDISIEIPRGTKVVGSCPSYKQWSWTIFHPEDGTLRHGGTAYSPQISNIELSPAENEYCIRLADWWLDVLKKHKKRAGKDDTIVQQIGASDAANTSMFAREHRLIKDASPHAPPRGYFDCTVEVLQGHMNENGVYSLYVTDYTHNESIAPVIAGWCIPALSDLVFKIELWNEASLKGPELKNGGYYEIKNVRIKESTGGYWEGSFSEIKKLRELDDEALEGENHLVDLLRRKKAWQDESDANGTHQFPHQLFQDASPDTHFDCTVEVVRISVKNDRKLLYVTDYTPRSDNCMISPTADWTRGIDQNLIVKVGLYSEQMKAVEALQDGDFISIRKMRLKSIANGTVGGMLGGEERLIYKLDPRTTGNEHCLALLERKEAWEDAQQRREEQKRLTKKPLQKKTVTQRVKQVKPVKKKPTMQRLPKTSCVRDLEKLHPEAASARFLVLARVVDYYPDNVEDFISLYCSSCGRDIPETLRICTNCDSDMADTNARPYFKFTLMIEDDEGARLQVPVVASKELPTGAGFLADVEPVDFTEDEHAFEGFKKRLRPLLGELLDNHKTLLDNSADGELDPETPYHNMILTKLTSDPRIFFFDYTPLSQQI